MIRWDPAHYLHFGDERTRPALDLVSRIRLNEPGRIIDLGCGPGNSTQVLRQRWPAARVVGLDHSPEMIAAARAAYPDQDWILADIEEWSSAKPFDLIFSNAALHWMRGPAKLVGRLFGTVAPGGALAFQVPSDAHSPLRLAIQDIADDPAWRSRMGEARTALTLEEPQVYYDTLAPLARSVDLWETLYYHPMASPAAIVDWISTTGLRPFLGALDSDQDQALFLARLEERLGQAYRARHDGRVLFPFRRLFLIAYA